MNRKKDWVREYQKIIESFGGEMPIVQCERVKPRIRKHPWPAENEPQMHYLRTA